MAQPLQTAALPGVSELLRNSWHQFKLRWPTYFGILIAPLVISAIFGVLTAVEKSSGPAVINSTPSINPALLIILVIAMIVAYLWSSVALVVAIKEDGIGVGDAYSKAKSLILPYLWVNILLAVIVGVGFILLVIPGILFMLWYAFATYIVIDQDNIRGMDALRKSKEYMQGNIGAVFWRGLAGGLIIFIPVIILTAIIGALVSSVQVSSVISNIISYAVTPLLTIFGFLLYRAVKAKKEAEPHSATPVA